MIVTLPISGRLQRSGWYNYLVTGFKEVAGGVIQVSELVKDCFFIMGKMIIPIDVDGRRIWYDFCDFAPIHPDIMKDNDLYFKVQYYDDVVKDIKNIFPIGFGTSKIDYFQGLSSRRKIKEQKKYKYDILGIFRTTNYSLRKKCIEIIKKQKNWNTLSGLCFFRNRPDIPKELMTEKLPFGVHLERQSKSKICVSLPGVGGGDDWCWRETEVLGMGGCLLNIEMNYLMPGDDEHYKKNCQITIKKDLSDLVEKINYYLTHEEERKQIAKNGLEYYEQWLTSKAMAQNIIDRVKDNG